MIVKVYLYPEGIDFRNDRGRIVYKPKMKYIYNLDIYLTLQKRYSRKWKKYIIDFPPELNSRLEELMGNQMSDKFYNFYLYGLPKFIFEICCDGERHYFHNNPWFVGEVFVSND